MSKLETQVTAAITAFIVIGTVSAVLSLGFFIHVNKETHVNKEYNVNKDEDLDICILFLTDLSVTGIKGACNFIIIGEAIVLALLLTAIGSIAVSTCISSTR